MNTELIKKIIAEEIPCYFISPHLDDAALSAGGLIAYLSQHTKVEVVTVFTEASSKPYTLSAKAFLKQCGGEGANALFEMRRAEDKKAYSVVGIKPQLLSHVDALFRKIASPNVLRRALSRILPEFLHVYPTYRWHIVSDSVSRHDSQLMSFLAAELTAIVAPAADYVVFCPLALRSHIDHILTRDVCLKTFGNVIMWQDFPYNIRSAAEKNEVASLGDELFRFEGESETKAAMLRAYKSQVRAMFPDGEIPSTPEVYYSPRRFNTI
jgi:LmbE family N-acetylglucosaminyl deacetylase